MNKQIRQSFIEPLQLSPLPWISRITWMHPSLFQLAYL